MNDSYVYIIVALLPLAAFMLTIQANPYNALVIRGILGAVAALVYAVLGAADVALTEALVGTMLAITLYAVAVRSSLVMRLGVLKDDWLETESDSDAVPTDRPSFTQLITHFRTIASRYHLRLELILYPDLPSLNQGLTEKEVHVTCSSRSLQPEPDAEVSQERPPCYQTTTRIRRLYNILQTELPSSTSRLIYVTLPDSGEKRS
ncbi:DUF4040 domain-containing protein [Leptothermofonsia sp. ETS-13]|uniref:DUF4040 domain-containing protein n=1 Tax=Leptothermofonsia sp. ETS-13 TaxID=3035696 RepID=UPI003BA28F00